MKMDYKLLQKKLDNIQMLEGFNFFEKFFLIWGIPQATFDRMKTDHRVNINSGLFISNKAFFMSTQVENLYSEFSILQRNGLKSLATRLIILENKHALLVYDSISQELIVVEKSEIKNHYEIFYPLIGKEKNNISINDPISINIAEIFANTYNELLLQNGFEKEDEIQNLICFLSYLAYLDSQGKLAGRNNYVCHLLKEFGLEMDIKSILIDIQGIISQHGYIQCCPIAYKIVWHDEYLVSWNFSSLNFSHQVTQNIINIFSFDWSNVQPEVFGCLLQESMANKNYSPCYTTNDNIHKVVGPLFLDELVECFEKGKKNCPELRQLANRIEQLCLFDPACGTGNFLIFAYKEIKRLCDLINQSTEGIISCDFSINNLYGIDSNPLAVQIAIIALYIAKSQLEKNIEPLTSVMQSINIHCLNPLRVEWDNNIPHDKELYIFGNPPYKGAKKMSGAQISDARFVLGDNKGIKELDYAACWFVKAARIFRYRKGAFAYVTTNSLTQGQQVSLLWPLIFEQGCYIQFAYRAFKWKNDARNNTAVTVVIIGIKPLAEKIPCEIFDEDKRVLVDSISPYLTQGNSIVKRRTYPLSKLPYMEKGNMPYDQGNLLLSPSEYKALVADYPQSIRFLRRVVGSDEFINGIERWCLWIPTNDLEEVLKIPPIQERIDKCREFRSQLKDVAGRKLSLRPHQFREVRETTKYSLVVPAVSSERREYIPIGFVDHNTIVTNLSFVIYDCEPWVFAVICSRMHQLWIRTVCGGLETRLRYSSQLGYNTFPFPELNKEQKDILRKCVYNIIAERELESQKTLAEIYAPDKMSIGLKYAHHLLDLAVEKCYREIPFVSDQERLDYLFDYYKHMTEDEVFG